MSTSLPDLGLPHALRVALRVMLRESLSREEIESSPQYSRLKSSEDVRDNPRFGVLTWIQPEKEVQDMPRVVSCRPVVSRCILTDISARYGRSTPNSDF